ncbi:MAG: glycerophosphodiester phosphodiesterase [Adhaeribacter sp.]
MNLHLLPRLLAAAVLAAVACPLGAAAQGISLTKFTYSPGKTEIGQVVASPAQPSPANLKLVGKQAALFSLDKNNNLSFRQIPAAKGANTWYDVVLKYKAKGKTRQDTLRVVQDDFIRNPVIAHRGAWKNTGASENSLAALQQAVRLGCSGSEFDVHMAADSVLVVFHDHHYKKIHLEKTPSSELIKLKLDNGESLPTLEAYLKEGLKQNKTRLILEMKPSSVSPERGLATARKTVALVNKYRAQGWVDYISFDYDMLRQVLALNPYAKVAYLKGDKTPAEMAKDKFYGLDYNLGAMKKNPEWFEQARQHGLTVNVWTVNDEASMDWLFSNKADFIITNEPELLLQKLKQAQ